MRCNYITLNGSRCKRNTLNKRKKCWQHIINKQQGGNNNTFDCELENNKLTCNPLDISLKGYYNCDKDITKYNQSTNVYKCDKTGKQIYTCDNKNINMNKPDYMCNFVSLNINDKLENIPYEHLLNKQLIVKSGGGDIYKVTYNNRTYVYKEIKQDINKIIRNLNKYSENYKKMSASNYLASPIHIISRGTNIVGYTMPYLQNHKSMAKLGTNINKNNSLVILRKIILGFIDIKNSGMMPCPEHGDNILIDLNNNDLKIIDLDDIEKCNGQSEREILEQLNLIFDNVDKSDPTIKFFFDFDNFNELHIKPKYTTFQSVLNDINRY